jgi:hypothetical protein
MLAFMLVGTLFCFLAGTVFAGNMAGFAAALAFMVFCIALLLIRTFARVLGGTAVGVGRLFLPWEQSRGSKPVYADYADGKRPIAGAIDLEYVDENGGETERYIEARSLEMKSGRLYLWGYCEQRHGMRSFRVDRIAALRDGENGEIVPRDQIAAWLMRRSEAQSPGRTMTDR